MKTLIISYLIIGVWGIVTYITHINLYVLLFANAFDYSGELYVGNGTEVLRGVLSSSASGNQSEGAIPWGQISLVMLTFGLFYQKIDSKILKNSFIILAVLNCFLSTKRSVIVPMLLLLGYIFVNKGIFTRKNLIRGIGIVIIGIVLYINVPVVREIYHSNIETALFFWDDDLAAEHDFKGSDKSMRVRQAIYVNNLISDHFLTGLGYGYPIVHNMKYHGATDAWYFESLYLDAIASSGYIGLLVWIFFFFLLINRTNIACRNKLDNYSLHGGYVLSVFLTNIYCSFAYYMIVTALFIKYKQIYIYSIYRPQCSIQEAESK
ncbi:O-antigen ligase family protein [Bacteroides xylanisolvens]|uniref:O-antigen ligase family protein n=1 Tax=Bacteroides xylanisolvens TaxID=371601 RepID=UPI001CDD7707|nr:O-antigen ligase family protein [Bacteroides xylanisolvens]MCA4458687.1 O-antigen ligase family protein [Bacteroides xylanisolvens]MCA4463343.1 O-antigen ligase family protein [Bacteroides xylanisolvens]MCA4476937.1 O-antigen ligase family protein [Bacteroides xylanisolvens]MCA4486179.1 O-antigen ligase family protein [Bacteroides xylanisolvens]